MSSIFPSGGLAQAYTALGRFIGIEQNTNRTQSNSGSFASQVKKSDEGFAVDKELSAQTLNASSDGEGFKEFFVANSANMDPNAPRGSYVNIVV